MGDILAFWSLAAVATAFVSGIVMAGIVIHLRPDVDTRLLTYLTFVWGFVVFLPTTVQRYVESQGPPGADLRTLGTFLLYTLAFAPAVALTLAWHRRRHPR